MTMTIPIYWPTTTKIAVMSIIPTTPFASSGVEIILEVLPL